MEYRREKKEFRKLCEMKRKEDNERWERRMEEAKSEELVGN